MMKNILQESVLSVDSVGSGSVLNSSRLERVGWGGRERGGTKAAWSTAKRKVVENGGEQYEGTRVEKILVREWTAWLTVEF